MKTVITFATLALAAAAQAQSISPGLWESSSSVQMKGGGLDEAMGRMQAQMAQMSPGQRQMVEQMMAAKGAGGPTRSVRVCLSAEQIARGEMPHDEHCSQQTSARSGNKIHFTFECGGAHPARGEGDFTIVDDKTFESHMSADTTANGQAAHIEIKGSGKWLGSDCGTLKPAS